MVLGTNQNCKLGKICLLHPITYISSYFFLPYWLLCPSPAYTQPSHISRTSAIMFSRACLVPVLKFILSISFFRMSCDLAYEGHPQTSLTPSLTPFLLPKSNAWTSRPHPLSCFLRNFLNTLYLSHKSIFLSSLASFSHYINTFKSLPKKVEDL